MAENIINVTDSNFESMVLQSDIPVMVDFWASWCAPCRAIAPIVEEMSNEYAGKVRVAKMNVDENREVSTKYGIMSIPAVFIFKDGEVVEQIIGLRQKEDYVKAIESHLG